MRVAALTCLLMLWIPATHADVTPAEINEYLRSPIRPWTYESKELDRILRANLSLGGLQAAAQELAIARDIEEAAALLVLEAELRMHLVSTFVGLSREELPPPRVVEMLHRAVAMHPQSEWIWRVLLQLSNDWGMCRIDAVTVDYFRRPGAVREFIAKQEPLCKNWVLYLETLESRTLLTHWRMTELLKYESGATRAAVSGQLLAAARADESQRELAIFAARRHWLDLAAAGLSGETFRQAAELPGAELMMILDARHAYPIELEGTEVATAKESAALAVELRTQWLIALADQDRLTEARQWRSRLAVRRPTLSPVADASTWARFNFAKEHDRLDELVWQLSTQSPEDPFDVFVGKGEGVLHGDTPIDRLAIAHRFARDGNATVAADMQDAVCRQLAYQDSRPGRLLAQLPQATSELRTRFLQLRTEAETTLYGCRPVTAAAPADTPRASLAYVAKELPAQLRTSTVLREIESRGSSSLDNLPKVPGLQGVYVVRAEISGPRWAAVSLAKAVDPTGEVAGGGYWLHMSDDAGKSWRPPLYLGLQELQPYVVLPSSKLSLIEGDTLRLEVLTQQLRNEALTLPPVLLPLGKPRGDLYIERSLAELQRDSDGDGLTDVLEDKLRTDPLSTDTDEDGVADNVDTLPRISMRAALHPDAAIYEATLAAIMRGMIEQPSNVPRRVLFLEADDALFNGLAPRLPVVVLRPGERAYLDARYGIHFTIAFPSVWFNRAHTRAHVTWSAGWYGSSVYFERTADGWTVEVGDEWIT